MSADTWAAAAEVSAAEVRRMNLQIQALGRYAAQLVAMGMQSEGDYLVWRLQRRAVDRDSMSSQHVRNLARAAAEAEGATE